MYKILIESGERFGNNIKQLLNAIYLAEKTNTPLITFKFDHFNTTKFRVAVKEPRSTLKVSHSFFYNIKSEFPDYTPPDESTISRIGGYIKPLIHYIDDPKYDYENGLFVHIRSGDIFSSPCPHPKYMQPPLDYYLKIFHLEHSRTIYIFHEDTHNPVVNALKEIFPNISNISIPMENLIGVFLKARYVVSGNSTLIASILIMNRDLVRHYSTASFARSSKTIYVPLPGYIKEWRNTKEQQMIMLNYKRAELKIG